MRIQRLYLDKFADLDHQRIFAVHGVSRDQFLSGEKLLEYSGDHGDGLDTLSREALKIAEDSDWLVFLDSDAVPIAPLSTVLDGAPDFVAIQRVEHLGNEHPHPSFTAVRAGLYRKLAASWRNGLYFTVDESGRTVSDVGSGFVPALRNAAVSWRALRRMKSKEIHPVFFGLYGTRVAGPLFYHHGAGSKRKNTAIERFWQQSKPVWNAIKHIEYWARVALTPSLWSLGINPLVLRFARPRKIADRAIRRAMSQNTQFWRQLVYNSAPSFAASVRKWGTSSNTELDDLVQS